jgi:hypothetical protein
MFMHFRIAEWNSSFAGFLARDILSRSKGILCHPDSE